MKRYSLPFEPPYAHTRVPTLNYDWDESIRGIKENFNRISIQKFKNRMLTGKPFMTPVLNKHIDFYIISEHNYCVFSINLKYNQDIQKEVFSSSSLFYLLTGSGITGFVNFKDKYNIIDSINLGKWRNFFLYTDRVKGFLEFKNFIVNEEYIEYPVFSIEDVSCIE